MNPSLTLKHTLFSGGDPSWDPSHSVAMHVALGAACCVLRAAYPPVMSTTLPVMFCTAHNTAPLKLGYRLQRNFSAGGRAGSRAGWQADRLSSMQGGFCMLREASAPAHAGGRACRQGEWHTTQSGSHDSGPVYSEVDMTPRASRSQSPSAAATGSPGCLR